MPRQIQYRPVSAHLRRSNFIEVIQPHKQWRPRQGNLLHGHHNLPTHHIPKATSHLVEKTANRHMDHCRCIYPGGLKIYQRVLAIRCPEVTPNMLRLYHRREAKSQELAHSLLPSTSRIRIRIRNLLTANTRFLIFHKPSQVPRTHPLGMPYLRPKVVLLTTRTLLSNQGCPSLYLFRSKTPTNKVQAILWQQGSLLRLARCRSTRIRGNLQSLLLHAQRPQTPSLSVVPGHQHRLHQGHCNTHAIAERTILAFDL